MVAPNSDSNQRDYFFDTWVALSVPAWFVAWLEYVFRTIEPIGVGHWDRGARTRLVVFVVVSAGLTAAWAIPAMRRRRRMFGRLSADTTRTMALTLLVFAPIAASLCLYAAGWDLSGG